MLIRTSAAALAVFVASGAIANPGVVYNDALNDISNNLTSGNGTLDLVSMEVSNTATDLVFSLRVNGDLTGASATDWGKFMIGIATGNGAGTTSGNGWGRPINMNAANGGMTHWIGSWVDGSSTGAPIGGAEAYSNGNGGWNRLGATWDGASPFPGSLNVSTRTIDFTVSLASLNLSAGSTFYFDAYSSGGGGSDSAIDALANPGASVQNWGDSYTSSAPNIFSYTISQVPAPGALALLGVAGVAAGRRRRKA